MSKQVHISTRKFVALITCIVIFTASFGVYLSRAVTTSPTAITLSSGPQPGTPDYTVWVESSVYYAKNKYGETTDSNSNASVVLRNAFGNATGSGVWVHALYGTYTFDNGFVMTTGCRLSGDSMEATKFVLTSTTKDLITLYGAAGGGYSWYITIENIYLFGSASSSAHNTNAISGRAAHSNFRNIHTNYWSMAVNLLDDTVDGPWDNVFDNLWIDHSYSTVGAMYYGNKESDNVLTNSHIQHSYNGASVYINGTGGHRFTNDVFDNDVYAIQVVGGSFRLSTSNIDQSDKHGIYIQNSSFINILGSKFNHWGNDHSFNASAIYIEGGASDECRDIQITGNWFNADSHGNYSIGFSGAGSNQNERDITIVGNDFRWGYAVRPLSMIPYSSIIHDNEGLTITEAAPYTYIISVQDGMYYAKGGTSGAIIYQDQTAADVIDPCITTNSTIYFKEGTYYLDSLMKVDVSAVHFIGSGWGTNFFLDTTAGFNISSTANLYDISFENINFTDLDGTTANYMITSAMPSGMRISHFTFSGNKVAYFGKAGTIPLNLTNLEVSTIENNYFYLTQTAFIQLLGNLYVGGNNKIFDNVFYGGYTTNYENAIRVTANAGTAGQSSSAGEVFSWGNQWFGEDGAYGGTYVAWNLTSLGTYGYVGGIYSSGDRYENTRILESNGYSVTYRAVGGSFTNNEMSAINDTIVGFDLGNFTFETEIANNYVHYDNGGTFYADNYTTDYFPNAVHDNMFSNTVNINASSYTRVYDNTNYNPIGSITNWKASDSRISPFMGYASSLTANGTWLISSCPIYLNVTGGTGVNVTITDNDNNIMVQALTSVNWMYLPIDFKVIFTYTTAPTVKVFFN